MSSLQVATEFWGFTDEAPDNKENEPFLKWLMVLASTSDADAPQLFSTSYGQSQPRCTDQLAVHSCVAQSHFRSSTFVRFARGWVAAWLSFTGSL